VHVLTVVISSKVLTKTQQSTLWVLEYIQRHAKY